MARPYPVTWAMNGRLLSNGTAISNQNKCLRIIHAYDLWNYPQLEGVCVPMGHALRNNADSIVPDTLWASGYEIYDRLSEPMRKFLEQHEANYTAPCKSDTPDSIESHVR
jgi:hypothetical protein